MHLYQSNRLEYLLALLVEICTAQPLADPLATEIIVVQHPGMGRWLAREWALKTGIAGLLSFPLPARALGDLYRLLRPEAAPEAVWQRSVLRWRILALLPAYAAEAGSAGVFAPLAPYLGAASDGTALFQLAGRIAEVFDRYQVYRPELLLRWEAGEDADKWQARLWRRLCAGQTPHRAWLYADCRRRLMAPPPILPERLHLFGMSSLAPVYWQLFQQLGRHMAVHCFQLSPCRGFWHDLKPKWRQAREQEADALLAMEALPKEPNALLVQFGQAGREFACQILEGGPDNPVELYGEPEGDTLLARVQSHLLNMQAMPQRPEEREFMDENDLSLQFHDCSSELREVQVLHDYLLDCCQRDPELTPGDILVAAPDIGRYAAAVQAVFGEAPPERFMPFALADQPLAAAIRLPRVFLELIACLQSRCTSTELLALLEEPALHRRFGLEAGHLPTACKLLRQAGICWGLDAEHRLDLDCGPASGEAHSFRHGLDRLLLGFAMGEADALHAGLYPSVPAGDEAMTVLQALLTLHDRLAAWRKIWQRQRPAAEWPPLLLRMQEDFFAPAGGAEGVQRLREAIHELSEELALSGYSAPLSPEALTLRLEESLNAMDNGQAFLSGRVTFCNMVPMRSLPFQIICLLGMNDGMFPRQQRPVGFDEMAKHPRLGDRKRREDDLYLFLEAMLSARKALYLSWLGHSQQDGTERPPSLALSALADYLDAAFQIKGQPEKRPSQAQSVQHPFQPFSPKNYGGAPEGCGLAWPASFDPAWLPATGPGAAPAFLDSPLPLEAPVGAIELSALLRFWRHPAAYFLQYRLGMALRREEDMPAEAEPFTLDGLDNYLLREAVVERLLAGQDEAHIGAVLRAQGCLPEGQFAALALRGPAEEGANLAKALLPLLAEPAEPQELQFEVAEYQVSGRVDRLYRAGRVLWTAGQATSGRLTDVWLCHLALAASGRPCSSTLVFRNKDTAVQIWTWPELAQDEAAALLAPWLRGYAEGQETALPFFPKSSLAWAESMQKTDDKGIALSRAGQRWQDSHTGAERDEAVFALLFSGKNPFDDTFIRLAGLLQPLLARKAEAANAGA